MLDKRQQQQDSKKKKPKEKQRGAPAKEDDKGKNTEAELKKKKDQEEAKERMKGDILYPPQVAVAKPGAAPKMGGGKGKRDPNANMEEVLMELVQDLRSELRQRDQEYE